MGGDEAGVPACACLPPHPCVGLWVRAARTVAVLSAIELLLPRQSGISGLHVCTGGSRAPSGLGENVRGEIRRQEDSIRNPDLSLGTVPAKEDASQGRGDTDGDSHTAPWSHLPLQTVYLLLIEAFSEKCVTASE